MSANSFHQNWVSRRNEMTSSWVNEVPFDRIFNATNSMRNMCGHFRGVQTECVLTGNYV